MQDDRVIQVNNTIPSTTYSNLVGNIPTDMLPASQTTDSGQDITIAPQNYIDAYGQLETNLTNAVNAQLNTIGANATAKGAMLTPTAPTQSISSYDYNRWVSPNLNATVAGLRQTGQLLAGQQAMNNMLHEAEDNYNKAIRSARARATARASSGGGGGGGGGGGNPPSDTVTGATTETTDDPANPPSTWTEKQKLDMINSLAYDDKLKMIELATKYGWDADKISELNKKYYGSKNSYYDAGSNKAGISVNYGGTYVPAAGVRSVGGGSSNNGPSNTIPFNVFTASIGR